MTIDDDVTLIVVVGQVLEDLGYEVDFASNGREGLEMALKNPPQLILLDVLMPVMDGIQTLMRLKKETPTKGIPVIMLTSEQIVGNVERAFKMGAVGYLIKPINIALLTKKVTQILPPPKK